MDETIAACQARFSNVQTGFTPLNVVWFITMTSIRSTLFGRQMMSLITNVLHQSEPDLGTIHFVAVVCVPDLLWQHRISTQSFNTCCTPAFYLSIEFFYTLFHKLQVMTEPIHAIDIL